MKIVTLLYSILAIALVTSCNETDQKKEQTEDKSSISKKEEVSQNDGTKLDSVPETDHTMNSIIYHSVTNFAMDLHLDYYKKSRAINFMTQDHPVSNTEDLFRDHLHLDKKDELDSNTISHHSGDEDWFVHYKLESNLFCLSIHNADNIIEKTKIFFFKYDSDSIRDITEFVAPKINFSLFYKCEYGQESLKSDSHQYYNFVFLRDSANTIKVRYSSPADYYEEATNIPDYDPECGFYDYIYFDFINGKYIKRE